jgi:hypothetical protein
MGADPFALIWLDMLSTDMEFFNSCAAKLTLFLRMISS